MNVFVLFSMRFWNAALVYPKGTSCGAQNNFVYDRFYPMMEWKMKELHKRSRHPKYKPKYKVINWREYEPSLRNRGNLTLWLSPSAIKYWKATRSGKPGRQQKYSNFDKGIHKWRRESRYYQQIRVENAFYRYQTILGKNLRSRRESKDGGEGRPDEASLWEERTRESSCRNRNWM